VVIGEHLGMSEFDPGGRLVSIGDTRLYVVERGRGYPLLILHGGPGMDHRSFGDYLDALAAHFRLIFVDQRGQGRSDAAPYETLTLTQMARDVGVLAKVLRLRQYALMGHSFGASVVLRHALDFPDSGASRLIIGSSVPARSYLDFFGENLNRLEPPDLRNRVLDAMERRVKAMNEAALKAALHDGLPFFFGDPYDPRVDEFTRRTAGAALSPDMLRHFAANGYGTIDMEDRLGEIRQPTLVITGRYDRVCPVIASEVMAERIPRAQLVILEHSGHMTFAEENNRFVEAVRGFLLPTPEPV